MQKTHYKRVANPDYLGAWSLYDNEGNHHDKVVTLLSLSNKEVKGEGGKTSDCVIATLRGEKPMILNGTNQKTLATLYGKYVEDWVNKSFTLFVSTVKVKGEWTECLRIRPTVPQLQQAPPPKPELTPESPKWPDAVKAIQDGKRDTVLSAVIISPENLALLDEAATIQN